MWVCVYVYVDILLHYYKELWQNIINWHFKQIIINDLWLYNHQHNKRNTNKQTKKLTVEPDQLCWEPEPKWLHLNLRNSRTGHQQIRRTTWVTIFNRFPYLQLQNAKLNLSYFTATSHSTKEITMVITMHWLAFFSGIRK